MEPITVYVQKVCHYCHKATDFLDSKGIEYTTVSIDEREGMEEWKKLKVMGVPTLVIGEQVIVGFHERNLLEILNLDPPNS